MSSYDFIVEDLRYSFSTVSGFEMCPYSFKLAKIDVLERVGNFFGNYGTLIHECFEMYFKDELKMYELSDYYQKRYDEIIVNHLPLHQMYLEDRYRQEGQKYFDFFYFDKENYDVLGVEENIEFILDGNRFIAKPDLVLRNKIDNKNILIDYKTSMPWKKDKYGKETTDVEKLFGYRKQMFTYTYSLKEVMNINIDKIEIWFPRADRTYSFDYSHQEESGTIDWMIKNINRIKDEEDFNYNNESEYFCNVLCGVRNHCKYKK